MMRLIFMGTPQFAVPILCALINEGYEIAAVVTQPDRPVGRYRRVEPPPVKEIALRHNLPVLQPASLREPGVAERLAELQPEVIIVAAFGHILPPPILQLPPLGCLNVHPSLLPKQRGASPIAGAILDGEEETGVTIMLMDEGMDTGLILAQEKIPLLAEDTAQSLGERLACLGATQLLATLPRWAAGQIIPQPQAEMAATYTAQLRIEDGHLDWRLPAEQLWRQCRAYFPWPGSYTFWQGKRLKLRRVRPDGPWPNGDQPGRVLLRRTEQPPGLLLGVVAGQGTLIIEELQLEGKRSMTATEFLRGHPAIVGTLLS
ncbi:MAG: methionyl-tRNA formyltransferase [Chloroflexi bacterium]|nr:methionyl-tRNA formyltransferase [Chloroflexota bacterium]MCL5075094.1 methionyl-tRNA formyltransferase [Chloroflexota bacterium]